MVHDPEQDPYYEDPRVSDPGLDRRIDEHLGEVPEVWGSDFDPFDDLDDEELELIQEIREAAEREWLIPDSWYDDGDDTRDQQPDG